MTTSTKSQNEYSDVVSRPSPNLNGIPGVNNKQGACMSKDMKSWTESPVVFSSKASQDHAAASKYGTVACNQIANCVASGLSK